MTLPCGFIRDVEDTRDQHLDERDFGAIRLQPGALPDAGVPWSAACSELLPPWVLDQVTDESCIAQYVAAAVWAAHRRLGVEAHRCELVARKALWWLMRWERGMTAHNVGGQPRTMFRVMNSVGYCRERWHPDISPYTWRPSPQAARMSADQRQRGDGRVEYRALAAGDLDGMRRAIAAGLPVGIGVDVSRAFASASFRSDEPVQPPAPKDVVGQHYMALHAYEGEDFLARNSWSDRWNRGGDVWLSKAYVEQGLCPWTVVRAPRFSDDGGAV